MYMRRVFSDLTTVREREQSKVHSLNVCIADSDTYNRIYSLIRPSDRRGIELARYRNMRSKRRCSLCLQFALILGAGPVLHRPTSLVIHRLEWNLSLDSVIFEYFVSEVLL